MVPVTGITALMVLPSTRKGPPWASMPKLMSRISEALLVTSPASSKPISTPPTRISWPPVGMQVQELGRRHGVRIGEPDQVLGQEGAIDEVARVDHRHDGEAAVREVGAGPVGGGVEAQAALGQAGQAGADRPADEGDLVRHAPECRGAVGELVQADVEHLDDRVKQRIVHAAGRRQQLVGGRAGDQVDEPLGRPTDGREVVRQDRQLGIDDEVVKEHGAGQRRPGEVREDGRVTEIQLFVGREMAVVEDQAGDGFDAARRSWCWRRSARARPRRR